MQNDKLLPCPFCGSDKVDWWDTDSVNHPYQIICFNCFNGTDKCAREEDAFRRWNTRKPIERIIKQLKKKIHPLYNVNWNEAIERAIEIVKGGVDNAE